MPRSSIAPFSNRSRAGCAVFFACASMAAACGSAGAESEGQTGGVPTGGTGAAPATGETTGGDPRAAPATGRTGARRRRARAGEDRASRRVRHPSVQRSGPQLTGVAVGYRKGASVVTKRAMSNPKGVAGASQGRPSNGSAGRRGKGARWSQGCGEAARLGSAPFFRGPTGSALRRLWPAAAPRPLRWPSSGLWRRLRFMGLFSSSLPGTFRLGSRFLQKARPAPWMYVSQRGEGRTALEYGRVMGVFQRRSPDVSKPPFRSPSSPHWSSDRGARPALATLPRGIFDRDRRSPSGRLRRRRR